MIRTLLWLACALVTATRADAQLREVRFGDVVIRHWPQSERLAQTLLPNEAMLRFTGLPDDILQRGADVTVYLAPDEARFDSLTGGRAPEWGAGVAMPQLGIIVIPGYVSDRTGTHTLPQTLRHELAHVALQRHLGDALVPRWFTEGFATWTSGEFGEDTGWQLRFALATDRAPPLDSLTLDWPLLATDARIAYLLSGSAVAYLYSLGSRDAFVRFLDEWRRSGDFEHSLRSVYILASPQFERLWRAHVKRHYGWIQVLSQTAFIWLVITLLVIVLFIVRRRRNRRRMQALRESELPDSPAYWLGEEEPGHGEDGGPGGSTDVGDVTGDRS